MSAHRPAGRADAGRGSSKGSTGIKAENQRGEIGSAEPALPADSCRFRRGFDRRDRRRTLPRQAVRKIKGEPLRQPGGKGREQHLISRPSLECVTNCRDRVLITNFACCYSTDFCELTQLRPEPLVGPVVGGLLIIDVRDDRHWSTERVTAQGGKSFKFRAARHGYDNVERRPCRVAFGERGTQPRRADRLIRHDENT
jgi:hypothetical protein